MKKTMTKLLALALAVLMTLSLAACGKKDSGAADKVELPVADGAVIGQGATAITVQVRRCWDWALLPVTTQSTGCTSKR